MDHKIRSHNTYADHYMPICKTLKESSMRLIGHDNFGVSISKTLQIPFALTKYRLQEMRRWTENSLGEYSLQQSYSLSLIRHAHHAQLKFNGLVVVLCRRHIPKDVNGRRMAK
jgi:hypothetical protein